LRLPFGFSCRGAGGEEKTGGKEEAGEVMRGLYAAIVLNMLLWMAVLGAAYRNDGSVKTVALVGFIGAAIAQHWAYYSLPKSQS
jgi:hypothetical protein